MYLKCTIYNLNIIKLLFIGKPKGITTGRKEANIKSLDNMS